MNFQPTSPGNKDSLVGKTLKLVGNSLRLHSNGFCNLSDAQIGVSNECVKQSKSGVVSQDFKNGFKTLRERRIYKRSRLNRGRLGGNKL
ncbi:hypothetical protein LFML04_0655 [Leptospirillum ferriphilum ML-04]|jgi:hypothetical protein|uniref:Uncharacterized protein n=1 Tax=Leptospirillum ferriphilum (strain ML-04) TaxID=1048260 RepID=J9Z8S3_LEPFM|nr:hypothetical protein LFML04_0655 [Leptospirillum ferriphilum ML-04]